MATIAPDRPARPTRLWLTALPVVIVLAAVGLALALPTPVSIRPTASTPGGPIRLSDAWPAARLSTIPGVLADGSIYQPMLIVDATTSVGTATAPDGSARFVELAGTHATSLRDLSGDDSPTVAATTYAGGEVFWLQIEPGQPRLTLWSYHAGDPGPVQIASDSGELEYTNSQYDLQVDGGLLFWATRRPDRRTEIHSVAPSGGPVRQVLDGTYQPSAHPWVITTPSTNVGSLARGRGVDVVLLNPAIGERRTAKATPDQVLACDPTWCRVTTEQGTAVTYVDEHPDGTGAVHIGNSSLVPLTIDVALLDRFEMLGTPNPDGSTQQLWLRDLSSNRLVLIAENATNSVSGRSGVIWWTTSGAATPSWQTLDLRQLD